MTHNDIYTKFLIEYDKANVTSSYPSLTPYEIATLLDRAYLALISQKTTGNNLRKSVFESDTKSISDLLPLVVHKDVTFKDKTDNYVGNVSEFDLPEDFNYFVQACVNYTQLEPKNAYDKIENRVIPIRLVSHQIGENFFATPYNMPWIKIPVCYIEDNSVFVLYDKLNAPLVNSGDVVHFTYIKTPKSFVKSLIRTETEEESTEPSEENNTDNQDLHVSNFILNTSKLNSIDTIG